MKEQGKAVIFCAPSGAGKTTIVKHLLEAIPFLRFSVSATTRPRREGVEVEGKDYYFLSLEDFKLKIENNEFYEWEEVYSGTFYGTLKSEVERIWDQGRHVIFDLDVVGGINLKKLLGARAMAVFVSVANVRVLEERLRTRNTDSEESLKKRISKASGEMEYAVHFDYILVNEKLDQAFYEAEQVVRKFLQS